MLSVVVIAKNEERSIGRCIRSLDWCDDILVVDDFSTDATVAVAEASGARVVSNKFVSFAGQRNWAMENGALKYQWVLHLDADEVSTPAFANAIQNAVLTAEANTVGFELCRKTMFFDRWLKYSDGYPVWIMRIVKKNYARFEECGHGEVPVPAVDGHTRKVFEPFLHYPFSKGISDWIDRHNRYSTREADHELKSESRVTTTKVLSGDAAVRRRALRSLSRSMPCRPVLRFVYQYFFKWGILDGKPGLVFSLLMSCYEGAIILKKMEKKLSEEV